MSSLLNLFEGIPDAFSDKDLDERVWQLARTRRGGSEEKYYFNKLTRKSFWTLPPTAYGRYPDADLEDAVCQAESNNTGSIRSHFPGVPAPPEADEDGVEVEVVEDADLEIFQQPDEDDEEEEEDSPPKALALQFIRGDRRYSKKADLLIKCDELGIETHQENGRVLVVDELWKNVDTFFGALHKDQGTDSFFSDCFQPTHQKISRDRQSSTSTKRKLAKGDHNVHCDPNKRNKNKRMMEPSEIEATFGNDHIYVIMSEGKYRAICKCNKKEFANPELSAFNRHITSKGHKEYVDRVKLTQRLEVTLTSDQLDTPIQRRSTVHRGDEIVRKKLLFAFLKSGVPLAKMDSMRKCLEDITLHSIGPSKELKSDYISMIQDAEEALQATEIVDGTLVSLVFDATPRQGDAFNVIARFVHKTESGKVHVAQRLIHFAFLEKSMDANHVCAELSKALNKRRIRYGEVVAIVPDGCSVNIKAHKMIQQRQDVEWLLLLCLSHMANNAGKQTDFVLIEQFWKLLQKVFSKSENAKSIFEKVMDERWRSYSETRWYSKYEVLASLYGKWSSLPALFRRLITDDAAVTNSGKLLDMLEDRSISKMLAIELAAYIDALEPIVKFCYNLEGDGQLVFEAGQIIDNMYSIYPNRNLPNMPSVNRLVEDAVAFVASNEEYQRPPNEPRPQRRMLAEVQRGVPRPRRTAAIEGVRQATFAGETPAARDARLVREARETAEAEERYLLALDAAIEEEARLQAEFLPQTIQEWNSHIENGIKPVIEYLFERMDEGGERHDAVTVYRSASLFNPIYASTVDFEAAHILIEKLRLVPALNKDEIIQDMKSTFVLYKSEAVKIVQKPGSILQWHFNMFNNLEPNRITDVQAGKCRYCKCGLSNHDMSCSCFKKLKSWWVACEVLSLLQTSSASSERVFSLLKNYWGDQQTRALGDIISLSLALQFNKRTIDQFDFEGRIE
jgi:hypothetical protein